MASTLHFNNVPEPALGDVFKNIIQQASGRRVFLFTSPMGSGKTTFINAACTVLGVRVATASPTYGLVHEYPLPDGGHVYHIDCYRLNDVTDALDAGIGDCIDSGDYCFIEWADKIEPMWPEQYVSVFLKPNGDNRDITVALV
jgi:tRNA threonylcarbamoyladenosine biosynthesis protein TsaE